MRAVSDSVPPHGWRILRSDAGRLWATRERPFGHAAETAGAARTVDGDDLAELRAVIEEQERIARSAAEERGRRRA
ncbi:hypothetical protein [Microbispora sp. ATCC PTA-5024]|uniref:hypothetical protein n=1 Tax=Microbispora sp. ATCC PTA-5024 TaxID=316330 RepID=UPI0003DDD814|nr:hypothetical protein [Microbispora sp. ATCC PTA-5024]ETK32454.1 hypothetical protein MPTA5024_29665 [Microbispora sp. ATCC PTA-5024]